MRSYYLAQLNNFSTTEYSLSESLQNNTLVDNAVAGYPLYWINSEPGIIAHTFYSATPLPKSTGSGTFYINFYVTYPGEVGVDSADFVITPYIARVDDVGGLITQYDFSPSFITIGGEQSVSLNWSAGNVDLGTFGTTDQLRLILEFELIFGTGVSTSLGYFFNDTRNRVITPYPQKIALITNK